LNKRFSAVLPFGEWHKFWALAIVLWLQLLSVTFELILIEIFMSELSASYRETVEQVSYHVASKVLPMAKLPEGLFAVYQNLCAELLEDREAKFSQAWQALPASARNLMLQAEFHGFYIANAWLQLSRIGQAISEQAESDDAVQEQEYNDIFVRLADGALKDSVRKLKKARTDRAMLNSIKQVMAP
jgi:hypothetical protein